MDFRVYPKISQRTFSYEHLKIPPELLGGEGVDVERVVKGHYFQAYVHFEDSSIMYTLELPQYIILDRFFKKSLSGVIAGAPPAFLVPLCYA